MKKLLPKLLWILLAGMITACGQSGPLYLPPPPPAQPHVITPPLEETEAS